MTVFNIAVTADTVCPFCYVATKQIANAIGAYKAKNPASTSEFKVQWHPFFLAENPPKPSVNKRQYLIEKFGAEMLDRIYSSQEALGKEHNINFSKDGIIGDTKDSHRLINYGGTKSPEIQRKIISAVYKSHFEDGLDISSTETLSKIAGKAGLKEDEVLNWLNSNAGVREVEEEAAGARAAGIKSVPNIVVSGHDIGTQRDVQSFLDVFQKVEEVEKV
ncbi:hypothetical protein G7Z17_g1433 [Cylindrodendrum hubeiense]|uniref:DSBA-like thioredoxin domain-containing protein n=1 Tax=Cylindrodendrum hubeiense TaxID=595255 RepID=A0A9P5HIE7_9HYPO|nr:hypothetical protein G7Z17_g1433 [Cylindrodendrum hubeiense]